MHIHARSVGWALGNTLATRLPLGALRHAIATRQPPPGLVHHSDRGVQYASGEYVQILHQHQMIPSMSRPANPYDNASCESFVKTLKREEIYATCSSSPYSSPLRPIPAKVRVLRKPWSSPDFVDTFRA